MRVYLCVLGLFTRVLVSFRLAVRSACSHVVGHVTGCCCATGRDNEKAIVKVNGKECWTKKFSSVQGKQICGKDNKNWNELKVKATCTAAAVKGSFTVSVTSTLNSGAGDESFGIDQVVFKKV